MDYTEEEERWIREVRQALKRSGKVSIKEDQVILRYYYSADLVLEKCLERLAKYSEWFSSPDIQQLSESGRAILKEGFVYSYGKAKDGRAFVVMNLSILDLSKHLLVNYYQAINFVLNKVIREEFVPGSIENYYFILDLDEKLLGLPISSVGDIIQVLGNAYSMCLERMMVVNCTTFSKWIYNRVQAFISQETVRKISLYTKEDVDSGSLREFIGEEVLERKYGGRRAKVHPHHLYRQHRQHALDADDRSETEYFSIEGDEEHHNYYKEHSCCGIGEQCAIY